VKNNKTTCVAGSCEPRTLATSTQITELFPFHYNRWRYTFFTPKQY